MPSKVYQTIQPPATSQRTHLHSSFTIHDNPELESLNERLGLPLLPSKTPELNRFLTSFRFYSALEKAFRRERAVDGDLKTSLSFSTEDYMGREMVKVVTLEEYEEFKKTVEEELKTLSKKMEEDAKRLKAVKNEFEVKLDQVNAELENACTILDGRIDGVEESSKSFVVRLREALITRSKEEDETETEGRPLSL